MMTLNDYARDIMRPMLAHLIQGERNALAADFRRVRRADSKLARNYWKTLHGRRRNYRAEANRFQDIARGWDRLIGANVTVRLPSDYAARL